MTSKRIAMKMYMFSRIEGRGDCECYRNETVTTQKADVNVTAGQDTNRVLYTYNLELKTRSKSLIALYIYTMAAACTSIDHR